MPILIQDIHDQEESADCPLCMETLEVDDINFFPCECGYQICRFCWHRIRTDENGLCPACRKSYPENPAEFKPLSEQELQKIRTEKKQREVARKQKITDGRKHLANVRVLQKNLVFVVGLSQRLSDIEILKRQEYFGKYGKILKVVLNSNTSYAGTQSPCCSAYVTYSKTEESLRAIQSVNNVHIDGRTLKASLGTTKYCSNYLKNQQCMKHDCMYLHEVGDEEASFTKEDMQLSKHQEYEQKLIQQMIQKEISQAQQEMRNKAARQEEDVENGHASAGSSPPTGTGTITQGLSVAQAVKKNVNAKAGAGGRPRRHSSSTPSTSTVDNVNSGGETESVRNIIGGTGSKAPRLCTSVGDRDPGSKADRGKVGSRRVGTKKNSSNQTGSQAPRHKKQQQINGGKKAPAPPRAHSASPSTQNTPPGSGSEHSPSSVPLSAEASAESSPSVTPLRDITGDAYKLSISNAELKQTLPDALGKSSTHISLSFADDSKRKSPHLGLDSPDRRKTSPIDIPTSPDILEDNKHRQTPQSDSGSSIDRKSPFVRGGMPQDQIAYGSQYSSENISASQHSLLARSRFMMLHKEAESAQSGFNPARVTNGIGFPPFGTTSNSASQSLLEDISNPNERSKHPAPAPGLLPPGLSGFPPANMGGWPTSNPNLSDSIPIKSTNNWEAAFGFDSNEKEIASSADDDLGFDPFLECSKGLADLMEKESRTQKNNDNTFSQATTAPCQPYFRPTLPQSSTTFSDLSASHNRPSVLPDQLRKHEASQYGYAEESNLINGFSNLLSNAPQAPLPQQHKMPFRYDTQQQMERSRFLQAQQHRLGNQFLQHQQQGSSNLQHLFASARGQKIGGQIEPGNPITPTKERPGERKNIQEWQNGLRALLPSVNINFAMQNNQAQQQQSRATDSSLGLSGLGLGGGMPKMLNMSHPPGMSNPMNHHPFINKQHVPPPPGVGFGMTSSRQWNAPESSSYSTPSMSSGRLVSPSSLQLIFAGGHRSESNPMPGAMPSYPPDPAIISGGENPYNSGIRQSRLFEHMQNRSSNGINSNNNSNEEQPHWMKSLQALTELESPMSATETSNNNLNALFSQRQSSMPTWPSMPQNGGGGLFSAPGYGPSQPPPGFQVRPSLSKPTEFGMAHNLLENQS